MVQIIAEYCSKAENQILLTDVLYTHRYHDTLKQIDGTVMEFYLSVEEENETPNAFDEELYYPQLKTSNIPQFFSMSPKQFRKELVLYISRSLPGYRIHSVSFLLTIPTQDSLTNQVSRQWTHVDAGPRMSQGILVIQHNTAPTLVYEPGFPITNNIQALMEHWIEYFPLDNELWKALYRSQECIDLIGQYGHLLNHTPSEPNNPNLLDADLNPGTVIHFPGNTIHAGPGLKDGETSRAVIFFAASPNEVETEYDPDSQYNELTLLCSICICVWSEITRRDRMMLLYLMNQVIRNKSSSPSDCCQHVCNATLSLFVHMAWTNHRLNGTSTLSGDDWGGVLRYISGFNSLLPNNVQRMCAKKIRKLVHPDYYALIGLELEKDAQQEIFQMSFGTHKPTIYESMPLQATPPKMPFSSKQRSTAPKLPTSSKQSILPGFCYIPFIRLSEVYDRYVLSSMVDLPEPEYAPFSVKPVNPDGNCLYRAICLSRSMKTGQVRFTHNKLRSHLHAFVQKHDAVVFPLWKNHCFHSESTHSYRLWKHKLKQPGTWGGYTEMILLSSLLKKKIVSICFRDEKLEIFDASRFVPPDPEYSNALQNKENYIFIWNHLLDNPMNSLVVNQIPNHFSLIEYDQSMTMNSKGLYFPWTPTNDINTVIDLISPPRK